MIEFGLNETQILIQDAAREFASRELAPIAAQLDQTGEFPLASIRKAAELGFLGINVGEENGGIAAGAVAYSLAITELARACAATAVTICVSNMVAEVVQAFGSSEQISEHVSRLCSGEYIVGGFALSESGAGSDPSGMTTRARKIQGGWVLNGSKLWISSGTHAGLFVVWARTEEAGEKPALSAFLVKGVSEGLTRGKPEKKMGQRASSTTSLEFVDVEIGDDCLLGAPGDGFKIAMMALDGGRIGIASLALGIGLEAADRAVAYANERQQFGKNIGSFQAIQWMLADSATELEAARLLTMRAAALKEQGKKFTPEASKAKLYSSERAFQVCNRALQVFGGYGYTAEYDIERFLRDVRVTSIYEGTSEIQRIVIGRSVARRFMREG